MTSTTIDASKSRPAMVYAQLMAVMASWALNIVVVKYLTGHMDIVALSALRIVVAFVTVTVIVVARFGRIPRLDRRQAWWLVLAGLLVVYVHQIALVSGLGSSSASNAALIMGTSPLLSALLAAVFYRERLSMARICGATLGLAGVALVILGSGAQLGLSGWGDAVVVLAVVVFVFGGLVIQRVSRSLDPLTILWYMYLTGCITLTVHAALTPSVYQAQSWTTQAWPWVLLLYSGVIASGVSNIMWNGGIARLGMSRAAMFVNWLPIFGLLFAALFLEEQITLLHLAGLACVLAGTWLGLRPPRGRAS